MTKLTTIEVKGKKFDVHVDEKGEFFTDFEGERVKSETLANLTKRLGSRITLTKKVSIPFVSWDHRDWTEKEGKLRRGTIVGIHGGNSNLIVKFEGQKMTEQLSHYHGNKIFLPPEHAVELERLGKAKEAARQAFDNFVERHNFNGMEKVRQALGNPEPEEDA